GHVARQARHTGIGCGVLLVSVQLAADHAEPEVVQPETELGQGVAIEAITDVQLLDLHVRARLDEEVDGVDAVVDGLVVVGRLLAGAVTSRGTTGTACSYGLTRLVVHAVAKLEEGPLPCAV